MPRLQTPDVQLCTHRRCATLLPDDAEICDECGSASLLQLASGSVLLTGAAFDRQVGFVLQPAAETAIGRLVEDAAEPEVDLGWLPGGDSVHRLHATLACGDGQWTITHRGQNPLLIQHQGETVAVEPGASSGVAAGDGLVVGRVRLQLVAVS